MCISDWSSDVCSSDLLGRLALVGENVETGALGGIGALAEPAVAGDKIIDALHATSGIAGKEGWQAAIETPIPHSYGHQPHPARTASAQASLDSRLGPQWRSRRPDPFAETSPEEGDRVRVAEA